MKKFFFPAVLCLTLALTGCSKQDSCTPPYSPDLDNNSVTNPDGGDKPWLDTLRPPINPFVVDKNSEFKPQRVKPDKTIKPLVIDKKKEQ